MSTDFFESQLQAQMAAWAGSIGCSPDDFTSGQLAIYDRPENLPWYSLLAVTFGVGTVLSVESKFRPFVEANVPDKPYRSFYPVLMQALADDCSAKGMKANYLVPGVCWALKDAPSPVEPPPGFSLQVVDAEWMKLEMAKGPWENGLGAPGAPDAREFRNRYGAALLDAGGSPVAIAGVFESYGMHEIGVDVAREQRGKGFGEMVVRAAANEIYSRGDVALYGCAATNIRSQRTALASGFLPSFADAAVSVAPAAAVSQV